jgi:hypothetical protein
MAHKQRLAKLDPDAFMQQYAAPKHVWPTSRKLRPNRMR